MGTDGGIVASDAREIYSSLVTELALCATPIVVETVTVRTIEGNDSGVEAGDSGR